MKTNRTLVGSEFQEQVIGLLTDVKEYDLGWAKGVEGKPTDAFWTLWRERKSVVKAAEFNVSRDGGEWTVSIRERDLGIELDECLKRAKSAQADRAFWSDRSNWYLIKNSKNTD
jgi:hypothetical protein